MKYYVSRHEADQMVKDFWVEKVKAEWEFVRIVSVSDMNRHYITTLLGDSMEWYDLWRDVSLLRDLIDWGINFYEFSSIPIYDIRYVYQYLNAELARKFVDNYHVLDRVGLVKMITREGMAFWKKERKEFDEKSEARRRFLRAYSSARAAKGDC